PRLLAGVGEERQQIAEIAVVFERLPIHHQTLGPMACEPLGGRREEAEVGGGARHSAVGERPPMAAEIGAAGEGGEHALDLIEHRSIVRVGAEEAQRLVQAEHIAGTREPGALESSEEHELPRREPFAVLACDALQRAQRGRWRQPQRPRVRPSPPRRLRAVRHYVWPAPGVVLEPVSQGSSEGTQPCSGTRMSAWPVMRWMRTM